MVRRSMVLAGFATMLVSSGIAAAATVERGGDGRTVARPDRPSAAEIRALDNLLERSSLSEQELEQYVQFVESEAGQWYMSVMNGTLLTAVDVAAEATAAELVTAMPQLVGDLR